LSTNICDLYEDSSIHMTI